MTAIPVGNNPNVFQGNLNRVLTQILVPGNATLNVTASYMGKSQVHLTFEGPFVQQHPTATGIVNSPEPYVMGQIEINLIRSQDLANAWISAAQINGTIGDVNIYSDSTSLDPFIINDCSIMDVDPGAFDGQDPVLKITLKGTFDVNAVMWAQSQS